MASKKDIKENTKQILNSLGGGENIISAAHCATRLRLVLKDESIVDLKELENVPLYKGQFSNAGQFQIILGSGIVDEVYKELIKLAGISESTKAEVKAQADNKLNPIQKIIKILADVFVPNFINILANAAYSFLPILVGFSATKLFGGNPYLGAVIGMIMVHPDLLNGYGYGDAVLNGTLPTWNIFGITIEKVGYQGTVLPVLAASYILAKLERLLRKVIPEVLDNLLTPLLSVLITSVLTFTVVGGIMRGAGDIIANGLLWLHDSLGVIGGAIFGLIYAPFTLTGMHHSLLPIDIQFLANTAVTGGSFLLAVAACNNVAQGAAALAAMITSKDEKLKSVALTSGISAMLGITEPAMFGVNLKLKFPFYGAMVGSAVGAAYCTFTNVLNISSGAAGVIGFVCIRPESIINFFISIGLAFIVGFLLTFILSKSVKMNTSVEK